jgi:hypothetical protein
VDHNGSTRGAGQLGAGASGAQTDAYGGGEAQPKRVGYGLPCARCSAYYAADLPSCPYCHCKERVSPAAQEILRPATALKEEITSPAEFDEAEILPGYDEDEPLFATSAHREIGGIYTAPVVRCEVTQHSDEAEPATVCRSCYQQQLEQVERLEAALSMDSREAAQLVYEAVWADPSPSDPTRTYQNAAQAILNELRRRAGLAMFMSTVRPYTH